MNTPLINAIEKYITLNDNEKSKLDGAFKSTKIKRGECWIKAGDYCNQIAFIKEGKFRFYHLDDDQNEITCYFGRENDFISALTSFIGKNPSREYIEALENSELLVIHRNELEVLTHEIPSIQYLRRIVAEQQYVIAEQRIEMLQSKTARERYLLMMANNPEIILNFPLQYIASYLGISPQHLSRLRRL